MNHRLNGAAQPVMLLKIHEPTGLTWMFPGLPVLSGLFAYCLSAETKESLDRLNKLIFRQY
jgi:hypothetical protein